MSRVILLDKCEYSVENCMIGLSHSMYQLAQVQFGDQLAVNVYS